MGCRYSKPYNYLHFTAIPCGNLSSPVNGQVRLEADTFGSQANYSCSEGYALNGNSTRECQADGQWSGSEPTCEGRSATYICTGGREGLSAFTYCISFVAIPCGNLSSPVNGLVTVDGSTFGSQANYSCSEGYLLNGNSSRMCQADGQWSGSEPTCEGMSFV